MTRTADDAVQDFYGESWYVDQPKTLSEVREMVQRAFLHGARWQEEHTPDEPVTTTGCRHEKCADLAVDKFSPCKQATTVDREDIAAIDKSMHNGSEMTRGNMAWTRVKAVLALDIAREGGRL